MQTLRLVLARGNSYSDSNCGCNCAYKDLGGNKICPKSGKSCRGNLMCSQGNLRSDSDPTWYSPTSIAQLAALFTAKPDSKFKLVAGDTGRGKSMVVVKKELCGAGK